MRILLSVIFALVASLAFAQSPDAGQVKKLDDGTVHAWSPLSNSWIDLEAFWLQYADSKGGLTWGRGSTYPEYAKVKEGDLFLHESSDGPCLMEFFHSRWRRANDVRRWNEAFNEFAGCPRVFD